MSKGTRKPARKSTPLPPVSGNVKVLQEVGTVGPAENRTGEIAVNDKPYLIRCADTAYQLFGWDERKQQPTHYDVSADCTSCDCPDFVSRAHRREDGLCKHCKAVAALVSRGKLPALKPTCQPAAEV